MRENDLKKLWRENKVFEELRNKDIIESCGSCDYRYYCGGCRSRAFNYFGDYLKPDPGCIRNKKWWEKVTLVGTCPLNINTTSTYYNKA